MCLFSLVQTELFCLGCNAIDCGVLFGSEDNQDQLINFSLKVSDSYKQPKCNNYLCNNKLFLKI